MAGGNREIDLNAVLRAKLPKGSRFIPRWVVRKLEKIICLDQLNEILRLYGNLQGVDFADAVLRHLNVNVKVEGIENLPENPYEVLVAANHPLGGLDGIALISVVGNRYGGKLKFPVNDLLMAVTPFSEIFLPINKHGAQSHSTTRLINEAYRSDNAICNFPAGMCSRNLGHGVIADLPWRRNFIGKCRESSRKIVPCYVDAVNSRFFYRVAKLRQLSGLKFNAEMIYLPSEIFKYRNRDLILRFGTPVNLAKYDNSHSAVELTEEIRQQVYNLAK